MNAPVVRVAIDHLVIDGVDLPSDQVEVMVAALTEELHRRVRADGVRAAWSGADTVRASDLRVEAGRASAADIGRQAGGAVHVGLTGGAS